MPRFRPEKPPQERPKEEKPKVEKEQTQEGIEVDEIKFEDLDEGDRLVVDTSDHPEEYIRQYDIKVMDKKRTKDGEIEYLIVEFEDPNEVPDKEKTLIAKMPGGFVKFLKENNITKGVIRTEGNNCLYFEDVNFRDVYQKTRSGKRRVRFSKSIRTTPIRKIVVIEKEK